MEKLIKILKNDVGWTFIETIIGIAIVLILSAGVGIMAMKQLDKTNVTAAISQMDNFNLALYMYKIDCNGYSSQEKGLEALVEKPILSPVPNGWAGPYLDKRLPLDPWV